MDDIFSPVKGKLGFGLMRLPLLSGGKIDEAQVSAMVDLFLRRGFTYFDTAHGYHGGESERMVRRCLSSRHERSSYVLADKLSGPFFEREEDIRPLFEKQIEATGAGYFDFYLMHAQNGEIDRKFTGAHAYEVVEGLKREGLVRHVGISFHDRATVLAALLDRHPQIEFVQLQLNYLDWDDGEVESGKCLEVCLRHGKPVIVMEPLKGGRLADVGEDGEALLSPLGGGTPASHALRFASGRSGVRMVLSGMSALSQMEENTTVMKNPAPLSEEEEKALFRVASLIRSRKLIDCTSCRYCVDGCPARIPIPDLFADMNGRLQYRSWDSRASYLAHTKGKGKASSCLRCGQCEAICPQHLPIRDLLARLAKEFDL